MRLCLSLFSLLITASLSAQLMSWQGVSFEREKNSEFGYAMEVEYRTVFEEYSQGELLIQGALNRKLGRNFNIATIARYQNGGPEDNSEFRLQLDLNFSQSIGKTPFSLKARMRFHRDFPLNAPGVAATNDFRPRLGIDAELTKRLTAFAEYESRYQIGNRRNEWTRIRHTGGLEYTLFDGLGLELFYRTEERINGPEGSNRLDRIVGLFLIYTLPDKRDRNWEPREPFGRDLIN